jgi:hypothetical protein
VPAAWLRDFKGAQECQIRTQRPAAGKDSVMCLVITIAESRRQQLAKRSITDRSTNRAWVAGRYYPTYAVRKNPEVGEGDTVVGGMHACMYRSGESVSVLYSGALVAATNTGSDAQGYRQYDSCLTSQIKRVEALHTQAITQDKVTHVPTER